MTPLTVFLALVGGVCFGVAAAIKFEQWIRGLWNNHRFRRVMAWERANPPQPSAYEPWLGKDQRRHSK